MLPPLFKIKEGAGYAYPSGTSEYFFVGLMIINLNRIVDHWLPFCLFFLYPLYCHSFVDLRFMITHMAPSNFSYIFYLDFYEEVQY